MASISHISSADRSLAAGLIVGFAALLTILWAGIVRIDLTNHANAVRGTFRTTSNLARVFEEHTARTLDSVDHLIQSVIDEYAQHGGALNLESVLLRKSPDRTLIRSIAIADNKGRVVMKFPRDSDPELAKWVEIGSQSTVTDDRLRLSAPIEVAGSKKPHLFAHRRYVKRNREFAGVVAVGIDPSELRAFYGQVDVGEDGIVALVGRDGIVRARYHRASDEIGQNILKSALFGLVEREAAGNYEQVSASDGVERYMSYRQLSKYPLIVTAGLARQEALADVRQRSRLLFGAGASITLVLAAAMAMLLSALQRRAKDARALAASESRFRALLDGIPDRVWFKDAEGRYLALNKAHEASLGMPAAAVIGKTPSDFLPPERAVVVDEEDRRVAQMSVPLRFERESLVTPGVWEDIIKVPIRDASGNLQSVVAVARDVSDRVEAERKARAGDRLLSRLMNTTQEGFWFIDNELKTLDVNPAMCALLGRSREELLGKDIFAFVDDRNAAIFRRQISKRQAGASDIYEIALSRPDGSQVHCVNSATPLFDESGAKIGSVGLWTDIGPLKKVQGQLEAARLDAEKANRAKTEFLSTMSHEIRTPLGGILGMAELLQGTELTETQRRYCDAIASSGAGLHALLSNILDMNRIDSGKLQIEAVAFNLRRLIDELAATYAQICSTRGNGFELSQDKRMPEWVRGDETRLRQVLINLLGNANKFTRGGRVKLGVSVVFDSMQDSAVWLRFAVEDTGVGIDDQQLSRLFQPFSQADSSITRQFGGSGLGLVIAKSIVELMGGVIRVESRPGRGSRFWFDIPYEILPAPKHTEHLASEKKLSARVLLVEDHPINREIMKTLLQRAGAVVRQVENGRLAVDAVMNESFDVVLMDCQMPVLSGYEATQKIREAEGLGRRTPIIALTANAFAEDRAQCFAAGMDDYLTKPVSGDLLIRTVRRWADQARGSKSP